MDRRRSKRVRMKSKKKMRKINKVISTMARRTLSWTTTASRSVLSVSTPTTRSVRVPPLTMMKKTMTKTMTM